jgi:hypothetical protein
MPRIRTIKPGFFKSEDVSTLPLRARLTWVGLWTQCDDHGRYKDSVRLIKGDIWPLDDVSLRDIEEDLSILEEQRRLVRYEVDGKRYLAVVNWHAHQAINRPAKPKHPAPPVALGSADPDSENHCDVCAKPGQGVLTESSRRTPGAPDDPNGVSAGQGTHVQLSEDSVRTHEGLTPGREGKGKEGKGGDVRAGASGEAPPPRCPRHITDLKPPNCGPCADARKARTAWEVADSKRRRSAPQCPSHRGEPADTCGRCRSEALAAEEDS